MSISMLIMVILSLLMALLSMAFYTLLERKLLGYFQLRKGPNKVLLMGLPQPLADAMKLFLKEQSSPTQANLLPFLFAPVLSLLLALALWILYPMSSPSLFMPMGALFFLCLSSMNVYSTLAAGWFSNSKYALLGSLRSVAQTISYEVSMAIILISPLILHASYDFSTIMSTSQTPKLLLLLPLSFMWLATTLAETNRTPFDFAEGESELVSGFNIEYSAGSFALIFMAEYTNILLMSLLTTSIFLIPHSPTPLMMLLTPTMTLTVAIIFVWVRATFPRLRYDQLMMLTWKTFLPPALSIMTLSYSSSLLLFL